MASSIYDLPGADTKGFGNAPEPAKTFDLSDFSDASQVALDPIGSLQRQGSEFNGWGDLGHQFAAGAGDTGAMIASVVGYIANKVDPSDDNVVATTMDAWRHAATDWASGERGKVSPTTLSLMQGPALESFGRNPMWWLAGQTANMAPMLVGATALAALTGIGATAAGAGAAVAGGIATASTFGAFGTLSAGDAINQINTAIDNVSDERLRSIHPLYEKYRDEGMSEAEARRKLSTDVAGLAPAAAFTIGGLSSLVGGPAQLARMFSRTGTGAIVEGGVLKRLVGGAALGAGGNAAEAATTTGTAQASLDREGIQPFDTGAFVNDIVTEALVGGVIGGAAETFAGPNAATRAERAAPVGKQKVTISPNAVGPDPTQSAALPATTETPTVAPQVAPVERAITSTGNNPPAAPQRSPEPTAQPSPMEQQAAPVAAAPAPDATALPDRRNVVAEAAPVAPTTQMDASRAVEPGPVESSTPPVSTTEATAPPTPTKPVVTDKAHRAVFTSVTAAAGEGGKKVSTAIREVAKLAGRDSKDLRAELQRETKGMAPAEIRTHIGERLAKLVDAAKRANPEVVEGSRGAHISLADREARTRLNTAAKEIADAHPPGDGDAQAMAPAGKQTAEGMKATSRARDAVKARVSALTKAYLELGKPENGGHTLPKRDKSSLNADLDHSPELLLMLEAKRLNDKITGGKAVAADFGRFLTREQQLRSGDRDQVANVRESRRVEGAAANKTAAKGAVEAIADAKAPEITAGTDVEAPGERVATKVPKSATRPVAEGKIGPASEVRKVVLSDSERAAIEARVNAKPTPEPIAVERTPAPDRVRETSDITATTAPKSERGKAAVDKVKARAAEKVTAKRTTAPPKVAEAVAKAAKKTDTDLTPEERESGDYTKGKVRLDDGVVVAIENPKGSTRTAADGSWSVKMPAHYGEIEGSKGADGDKVDVYIGDRPDTDTVFVLDQNDADTGKFDEHKVMWGFPNLAAAMDTYQRAFSDGRAGERFGGVTPMTRDEFRAWLKSSRTKKPSPDQEVLAAEAKAERGNLIELIPAVTRDGNANPYVAAYNNAARWLNGLSDAAFVRLQEAWGDDIRADLENTDAPQAVDRLVAQWQEIANEQAADTSAAATPSFRDQIRQRLAVPVRRERRGETTEGRVSRPSSSAGVGQRRAQGVADATRREVAELDKHVVSTSTASQELDRVRSSFAKATAPGAAPNGIAGIHRALVPTVLRRLAALAGSAPVKYVDPDAFDVITTQSFGGQLAGPVGGVYYRAAHVIYLPANGLNEHTVMHEVAHAAFIRALVHNRPMRNVMIDIMSAAEDAGVRDHGGKYALTNMDEFVAEAMSNLRLQQFLSETAAPEHVVAALELQSARRSLWDSVVDIARKVFGLPKATDSLLHAVLRVADNLDRDIQMGGGASRAMSMEDLVAEHSAVQADQDFTFERMISELTDVVENAVDDVELTDAASPLVLDTARDAVSDAWDTLRGKDMRKVGPSPKLLAVRTFDQIAAAARSLNLFNGDPVGRVFNAVQRIAARSNQIEQEWAPGLVELKKLMDKHAGPIADEFSSLMVDSTIAGVWPNKPLTDKANSHVTKRGYTDAWVRAQHAELARRFASLPTDLQKAFEGHAQHYADAQNRASLEVMQNRILTALGVDDRALAQRLFDGTETDADKTALGDAYDLVKDAAALGHINGPYFPLMRHGKYVVRGYHRVAEPVVTKGGNEYLGRESGDPDAAYVFTDPKAAQRFATYDENGHVRKLKPTVDSKIVDKHTGSPWGTLPDGSKVRLTLQDIDAERHYFVRIQNQHTEFVDNLTTARKLAHSLEQHGLDKVDVQAREYQPGSLRGAFMSSDLRKVSDAIEKGDAYKRMTDTQKREVQLAIDHMALRLLGENRIQSRSLPRRNVAGASHNVVKNAAVYNGALAHYLGRLEHGRELDTAMEDLQSQARTNDGRPGSLGRMDVYNEIAKRVHATGQVTGDSINTNPVVRRVMQLSFIDKLASPAYSVINSAQVGMISFPVISGRHGVGQTLRALQRAYSDVGALDMFRTGVKDTIAHIASREPQHTSLTDVLLTRAKNDGERRMIQFLIDHNSISPDAGFELASLVPDATGMLGRLDDASNYLSTIARQLPRAVEVVNRGATAIAAYRLEMAKSGDHDAAVTYAQQVTNMTQGIYNAQNAPPIFNHPLASLSLQFKKYGQMVYGLIGHEIGRAIHNVNPGDRAEALKSLATLAAMHVAVAGALGLPTEPFKWMVMGANFAGLTTMTWSDVEDWERQVLASVLGKDLGEVAARGITRALPGGFSFDLSSRLGMADLASFGEPKSNSQDDVSAYLWTLFAGAPGGLAMDYMGGAQKFLAGDYVAAAGKLVPIKVVADSIGAVQKTVQGKVSTSGNQTLAPYGIQEAVIRGFGFTPGREAETNDMQSAVYRATERVTQERTDLQRRWHAATPAERMKLWGQIETWNRSQAAGSKLTRAQLADYTKRRKDDVKSGRMQNGLRVTKQNGNVFETAKATYDF